MRVLYDQLIEINLDELKTMVNGPYTPDWAHIVPEFKSDSG